MEYAERLHVPLRWWAQGTMLVASLWLALAVALPSAVAWAVTAGAMSLLAAVLLGYGAAGLSVSGGVFRAGRARIGGEHLGAVTPLDPDASRRATGVEADARAYLLIRPYLKRTVKVEVTDPADPAPYWLVGTRRPDELARALVALNESSRAG